MFLLDWKPIFWSTREQYFCELSRRLVGWGITPIMTISEAVAPEVEERFREAGARLVPLSYEKEREAYKRHIEETAREWDVLLVQIRFFDYFSWLPRMCKAAGIKNIVFTEANSGEIAMKWWKKPVIYARTWATCGPLSRAIGISDFICHRLVTTGIPKAKTRRVYNGIDVEAFRPDPEQREKLLEEFGAPRDTFLIAFASSLLEWKRPRLALEANRLLAAKGIPSVLLMAGTGPLREELEREYKDNVRWLGHYPYPQRLLQGSDVFFHTSRGEAFGNVLAEAMACGIPVVATHSGATGELVPEGKAGLLIGTGEHEAERLARALERLAKDPEMRRRMGQVGVEWAREFFSVGRSVENTLAVYRELVELPGG